jgi:hypothetical protein
MPPGSSTLQPVERSVTIIHCRSAENAGFLAVATRKSEPYRLPNPKTAPASL